MYVKIINNNQTHATKCKINQEQGSYNITELENNKIEISVLTETWIKSNQQDKAWLNQYEFKQGNYDIITCNHLLPNAENATTNTMFLDDLTELLIDKLTQLEIIMPLGDFNMHIEEITSLDITIFSNTMEALGIPQHITQPMHNKGNILDLGLHRTSLKNYNHWMLNKHPTIRPLLKQHRYQHQEEQAKNSHKNNQGQCKTITNTPNGSIHTTHI